ncbi:MAG: efflux RND transporter periplasmic adaptor subunit [Candidatus Methylomirabilota bacterium]
MIGRWAIPICMVAMLAGITGCKGDKNGQASKQAPAAPPPAVLVTEVLQKTVPIYAEFVAQTDARLTVEVRARVQGILKEMRFKEGDLVKKDEVLYQIEPDEYQANLQTARAQLARAEADLQSARAKLSKAQQDVARYRPLAAARAVPQQDLDTALASEEVARAEVEQAKSAIEAARASITRTQLDLGYTTIRSPLDGLIGRTKVDVGNLVGKGEATLLNTVSSVDPIRVNFAIPEAEYLRLLKRDPGKAQRPSPPIELLLADGSAYPHKGRFVLADRAVDLKTGTLNLVSEFPNPTGLIRPGQFGRVRLAADVVNNAILVPQRAVQEIQGAKTVLVVGPDDTVALRTITPAETVGDLLIVRDGVQPGERVIVEGIQKARPGSKVAASAAPVGGEPGAKPAEKASEKKAEPESTEKKRGK